jgi:hypothetical protein
VHVYRDSAAVIGDLDVSGFGDYNLDAVAVTCESFINRVVDNFIDEVVKSSGSGRSDVHTGTLANCFEAFQNLDGAGVIIFSWFRHV